MEIQVEDSAYFDHDVFSSRARTKINNKFIRSFRLLNKQILLVHLWLLWIMVHPTLSHIEKMFDSHWFQICRAWNLTYVRAAHKIYEKRSHIPFIPTRYLTFSLSLSLKPVSTQENIHNKCRSALHAKHNRRRNWARISIHTCRNFSE